MIERRVLVIGLDNAGKTTLVSRLLQDLGAPAEEYVQPTIGVETRVVRRNACLYKIFDLGGSGRFRSLWKMYCDDATHIIIVVDGADKNRFFVLRDEIEELAMGIQRRGEQVLVVANKSDLPGFIQCDRLVETCMLDGALRDFIVKACNCSALHGEDVEEVTTFFLVTPREGAEGR